MGHRERADTHTDLPRELKDRVARALDGRVLTPTTLTWFVDAFNLPAEEAVLLDGLLAGSANVRVLRGNAPTDAARPKMHVTRSLHEHHYLGPDRIPLWHRTTQVLEATADGMSTYPYMFDTHAVVVDVVHGGAVQGPVRAVRAGVFAVDIELTRPLALGETTSIEYTTTFHYPQRPPPEFRRAVTAKIGALDIRVQFHVAALPRDVFYAEWPAVEALPTVLRPVQLEPDHSVHVFLASVEHMIVGFTWGT